MEFLIQPEPCSIAWDVVAMTAKVLILKDKHPKTHGCAVD